MRATLDAGRIRRRSTVSKPLGALMFRRSGGLKATALGLGDDERTLLNGAEEVLVLLARTE